MSDDLRNELLPLLWRLGAGVAMALAGVGVCAVFDLLIPLPGPIAAGLVIGAAWWALHDAPPRADDVDAPRVDLDADYALPHARDMRVRRLEDLIHGAQPSRRMTSRGLARTLGDIADERATDPAAAPLSDGLRHLIAEARHPDAENHPVGPIDRRILHRYLRELATGEERDR